MELEKGKPLHAFELLIAADEVTPQKMNDFRMTLGPDGQELFDRVNEIRKRILVVLDGMTHEEMLAMRKELGEYTIGFHDLSNLLMLYQLCITDSVIEEEPEVETEPG